MNDGYKYNWDEMIEIAFHINEHRINNTGWMMKWRWNGGVEQKAKLLLRECWSFLTFIFLHQQWKQCLEFALAKLREICKCLAGACNSNSHASGLHYLTFFCKNKAGKSTQWGESSQKMYQKSSALSIRLECEEVSLQIEFTTFQPKNHNLFVKTGTKRELEKKGIAATG
jgi:hypothetical protein